MHEVGWKRDYFDDRIAKFRLRALFQFANIVTIISQDQETNSKGVVNTE